ncbi:MAG: copper homeostasis protein CutC [Limnochordia bacterium]
MKRVVEVCCYTVEDVLLAYEAGAGRVELCADSAAGGTTPSLGLVEYVVQNVPIEVSVMIRPRGGDFAYSQAELDIMERDINRAAEAGAQCVVFGILTEDGFADVDTMARLTLAAQRLGLNVTCHRAFDLAQDPLGFARTLARLGVNRLLTSGQKPHVTEGLPLLRQLVEEVGDDLSIMPCGKISSSLVEQVLQLGVSEIHCRRVETVKFPMLYTPALTMGDPNYNENLRVRIDKVETARIVELVRSWDK